MGYYEFSGSRSVGLKECSERSSNGLRKIVTKIVWAIVLVVQAIV